MVVGEYDTGRGSDCSELFCAPPTQAIKVENVVVHVGYEEKIFRHDIALIVLKDEMKYSGSYEHLSSRDVKKTTNLGTWVIEAPSLLFKDTY